MRKRRFSQSASRQKRPYLSLIAFLVLLGFMLFIAISSWNYHPPPGEDSLMAGRLIYLPIVARGACTRPPCPPAPTVPPYPAERDFTCTKEASCLSSIPKMPPAP